MLTRKQKDLLVLIRDRLNAEGVPPSFDEMKDAIGLKSKSGIHRLIMGLEERGFIKRMPNRARALEILRMPENMEAKNTEPRGARSALRKTRIPERAAMPSKLPSMGAIVAQSISLPLYGRIAAGTPLEALREFNTNIDVPVGLLANSRGANASEHYALEISGDSMIEAGIMDGDHVIIRKCDTAENGAIVVALVDGYEATLKFLEKRGSQIALIPANKNYQPRICGPDQVKVQGKLVGLMRQY